MFGMGASELMIILVIILLLFGASKLPELGRSLGSGLNNFKKGLKEDEEPPAPPTRVAVRVEEPPKTRLEPPAAAPEPPSDAKNS